MDQRAVRLKSVERAVKLLLLPGLLGLAHCNEQSMSTMSGMDLSLPRSDLSMPSSNDLSAAPDLSPDVAPVVSLTKLKNPTWKPTGCQLIAANVGRVANGPQESINLINSLLPNHAFSSTDNLPAPKTAHAPPYDGEFAKGVAALGLTSQRVFPAADWTAPRAIMLLCLMVPDSGAPMGSSPDFAAGPILPNSLFPLLSSGSLSRGSTVVDSEFPGSWPALGQLHPPLSQDGWSHLVNSWWDNTDYVASLGAGSYRYDFRIEDSLSNGWTISVPFTVQ